MGDLERSGELIRAAEDTLGYRDQHRIFESHSCLVDSIFSGGAGSWGRALRSGD